MSPGSAPDIEACRAKGRAWACVGMKPMVVGITLPGGMKSSIPLNRPVLGLEKRASIELGFPSLSPDFCASGVRGGCTKGYQRLRCCW